MKNVKNKINGLIIYNNKSYKLELPLFYNEFISYCINQLKIDIIMKSINFNYKNNLVLINNSKDYEKMINLLFSNNIKEINILIKNKNNFEEDLEIQKRKSSKLNESFYDLFNNYNEKYLIFFLSRITKYIKYLILKKLNTNINQNHENKFSSIDEILSSQIQIFNKGINKIKEIEKNKIIQSKNEVFKSHILNSQINNNESIIYCSTVHNDIKCENCLINPIVGARFKCSLCENYNLCVNCEEKNSYLHFHNHNNFILIREELRNKNDRNYYSYKCLNNNLEFNFNLNENKNEYVIKNIIVKNDYNLPWLGYNETQLKCNRMKSTIFCENIYLPPLSNNQSSSVNIIFKNLKDMPKGNYISILNFFVNKKIYGRPLILNINLI